MYCLEIITSKRQILLTQDRLSVALASAKILLQRGRYALKKTITTKGVKKFNFSLKLIFTVTIYCYHY